MITPCGAVQQCWEYNGLRLHPCIGEPGGRTVQELDLPLYKGTRGKNSTGARPHLCTREPGGRTVQELDLPLYKGTRGRTGARPPPVQGNQEEEQYRS